MGNLTFVILRGQTFATAEGEEFTVVDLVPDNGYAVVENLQEQRGVMNLSEMLEAIQTGVLVNVDSEHDEPDRQEQESD